MTEPEMQKVAQLIFEMLRINGCQACGALDIRCQVYENEDTTLCQATNRLIDRSSNMGHHHADEFEYSEVSMRWHLRKDKGSS